MYIDNKWMQIKVKLNWQLEYGLSYLVKKWTKQIIIKLFDKLRYTS